MPVPANHPTLGDLSDTIALWRGIDGRLAHWDEVEASFQPSRDTDRGRDSQGRAGFVAYARASNYLMAARDHHVLLVKMIDADWLTPYGAWSPLRALFENSFLALWILHPETSEERVKNGLAMVLDEHRQHGIRLGIYHRLHESASPSTEELGDMEKTKELHARIVADFNKLGAPYGLSGQSTGASVTSQIQQSEVFPGRSKEVAELVWRLASSLQHGDTAALYTTSKATLTEESQMVTVQFEPASFLNAYNFTLTLFSRAIEEMVMRSTTKSPATPQSAARKVKRPRKKKTQDGTGRTTP